MFININNLSFSYNKNDCNVLNQVNLSIDKGTITVLLGLNGCGKTTLIKLLAGLLKSTSGSIEYSGLKLADLKIYERSKIFSYVPQKTYIADDYFVRDYLTYGFVNSLKFYEEPTQEQLNKVESIAKEFEITYLLDKRMGQISGGERQIVTIASCIIQDTPIILLDEPTSALDIKNQNIVLTLLKRIAKDGKTIILSSHNANHALFLDSNVALMSDGNITEYGYCKNLITVDKLKSIYGDAVCYSDSLEYREISFKDLNNA